VHELEVREVDPVLQHVLRMQLKVLLEQRASRPVIGEAAAVPEAGEYVRRLEEWLPALGVMPDIDGLVAFNHRVGAYSATAVRPTFVGYADVAALGVPLPSVEGAFDDLDLNVTAEAQVRAEVFAVRVHHVDPARPSTPAHHFLAEVMHLVYSLTAISSDHAT
jgi:hypothetical protein